MLGVGSVTVGKLLRLPAPDETNSSNSITRNINLPAEDPLVPHVLDVHRVHDLGTLHLDGLVNSVWFKPGKHGEFLLDSRPNDGRISETLNYRFMRI